MSKSAYGMDSSSWSGSIHAFTFPTRWAIKMTMPAAWRWTACWAIMRQRTAIPKRTSGYVMTGHR
jgi:hypothetical protein